MAHDHSGMDMSGMSGMDMMGIDSNTNHALATGFWFGIVACVGLLTVTRIVSIWQNHQRRKLHQQNPEIVASRPQGWLSQAWATAIATIRETIYAQPVVFTGPVSKFFSPLPIGRWLLLAFYWIVILSFLWTDTILGYYNPYKFEAIAYRAAWVSVAQIPFIYLLSCKFNPISLLTGISYERFNWLHRWAARTVFLTVIVHWAPFIKEWTMAEIVEMQFEFMPMIKYGFGAWAVITWMMLSGFGFFRHMSYEVFVLQHIAGAGALLWLVWIHVPDNAVFYVWMSIAFVAFDWGMRIIWGALQNTHLLSGLSSVIPGYSARLEALPGDVVRVTLEDVDFSWKAGQHVYLVAPTLRPFEAHPFTIANAASPRSSRSGGRRRELTLLIQARRGFSRNLLQAAAKSAHTGRTYRTFLSGPWGHPPDLSHHETVVLIACSTGASFIIPLMQDLVRAPGCVRRTTVHWIIRQKEHFHWFGDALTAAIEAAAHSDLQLQVFVHVTGAAGAAGATDAFDVRADTTCNNPVAIESASIEAASTSSGSEAEEARSLDIEKSQAHTHLSPSSTTTSSSITPADEKHPAHQKETSSSSSPSSLLFMRYCGRPTVEALIRPSVEAARGETAVVVCGGLAITAQSRSFVARLSDERAVHKGTGAQGIGLWTETYGW